MGALVGKKIKLCQENFQYGVVKCSLVLIASRN